MQPDPLLIIQMQRMGDLVMTFPLMAWLRKKEPGRPIWVLAEPEFSKALMPFAPDVVFFSAEAIPALRAKRFHQVINLSHRDAARQLAGATTSASRLGAFSDERGVRILGNWHLYRASIVHNNRHNRLHWADLAALDATPPHYLPQTIWPMPRTPGTGQRVGLFVGASEAAKRPDAAFWGELARQLIRRGSNPVFLGGPGDRGLAQAAARLAGISGANLAGRFSLEKFADFIRQLDLLVTPDTGPMHVGAWVRALTLNISMGPVNPWETAPPIPGHLVLRAEPSCTGCWQCVRRPADTAPPCHARFAPSRLAALIQAVLHGNAHRLDSPGLRLWRTARDARGLFTLEQADNNLMRPRDVRGDFWREIFLSLLGGPRPQVVESMRRMREHDPRMIALLARFTSLFMRRFAASGARPDAALWRAVPPLLRPLSGYLQLELENDDYSPQAKERVLDLTRTFLEHLAQ